MKYPAVARSKGGSGRQTTAVPDQTPGAKLWEPTSTTEFQRLPQRSVQGAIPPRNFYRGSEVSLPQPVGLVWPPRALGHDNPLHRLSRTAK